ncbi:MULTISPECIES: STAS domain-containing protein [unclassified Streptomyces]|jgi:anti-sigma B factor antagonist|uniref:STAS domain-containing protein n=1 Tax=unclassified Streptomyces TaxID=2593676 RepID=UPI003CF3E8B0
MTDVSDALDMTVHHISDRIAVVAVAGDVDLHTAVSLRAYVSVLLDQGARHLVLDLAGVDYVDSSGLSTFITLLHTAQRDGGALHLADVPDRLVRMLTMTGIDELLPVHPTVADAVAAGEAGSEPSPG